MYERIFGRGNLAVLNRTLANAQLDIQLDDITIHIVWLSYSHYTRPPEKQEVTRAAPHRHSFFEMHLFLRGSAVYEVRDAEHTVSEGELLFLGKEVPHQHLAARRRGTSFPWPSTSTAAAPPPWPGR